MTYPITVLTGPNGMGKSSLLQAFWGMPEGKSLEVFWFSTSIDAIEEGGVEDGQHRFVYGHWLASQNAVVHTRKARVTKTDRGYDYWEPTKATLTDGMPKMPKLAAGQAVAGRTKDRWNAVDRDVLFLNFKSELSAYDKFMYFGRDPKLISLKSKQDVIRRDSKQVAHVVGQDLQSYKYYGRRVTAENRLLSSVELAAVSMILGRQYVEARIVRHRLYGGQDPGDGLSVIFKRTNAKYSEAQAGSGEVAVVSAVVQVLAAKPFTLILLDEPEVSLHPLAQRRLLEFLLNQIKKHKHQVIVSTHSSEIIRGLPPSAVKVLSEAPDGKFAVVENISPTMAFAAIGAPTLGRLSVFVEDKAAQILVREALTLIDQEEAKLVDIVPIPGGAEGIYKYRIPTWMLTPNAQSLVFLDGDKKPSASEDFVKSNTIPTALDSQIGAKIAAATNCEPQLVASGSGGQVSLAQKTELQRLYMDWCFENVRFLPMSCPEHVLLKGLLSSAGESVNYDISAMEAKNMLLAKLGRSTEDIENSAELHSLIKHYMKQQRTHITAELTQVADEIKKRITNLTH
ncbi:MAG: ATP-binding protein [Betaproteobacteria bacterium]